MRLLRGIGSYLFEVESQVPGYCNSNTQVPYYPLIRRSRPLWQPKSRALFLMFRILYVLLSKQQLHDTAVLAKEGQIKRRVGLYCFCTMLVLGRLHHQLVDYGYLCCGVVMAGKRSISEEKCI